MTNWQAMQNCGIYNQKSIKATKKRAIKKAKKRREKQTNEIIEGFRQDLIERKTPAELQFESFLDQYKIEYEAQKIIRANNKHYIVDYYLSEYHAVIEIDGEYHNNEAQKQKDKNRTKNLNRNKIVARVIRFNNQDIYTPGFFYLFLSKLCPFVGDKLLAGFTTNRSSTPGMGESINTAASTDNGTLRIIK